MSSLSTIFKRAVKPMAIGLTAVILTFPMTVSIQIRMDDRERDGGRAITQSEKALLKGIFGNSLDASGVRIHLHDKERDNTAASVRGLSRQHIDVWGAQYYSDDYSHDDDSWLFGTFVHEATHLWQNQRWDAFFQQRCDLYEYELTPNSRFFDFCQEQQAQMVDDYAARFLHPTRSDLRHFPPSRHNALLQKVVEKQFPEARKTRLALTAKEKAARATLRGPEV